MAKEFVSGSEQDELIAKIQDELRRSDRAIHIRVLGEPGIGKTKAHFRSNANMRFNATCDLLHGYSVSRQLPHE